MENSRIIQEFLNYLQFEKHFSQHTARNYSTDLAQFAEFMIVRSSATKPELDTLLLSVDTEDIETFLAFLEEKRYARASIARKIAAIASFYKFLVKRSKVGSNPVKGVKRPKVARKPPYFLEYEDIKKLLETPPLNNWLGARDRAILEILYGTGIKVGELVVLNIDDIDFFDEVVHIRSKGKKERIVPINSAALETIMHYIRFRDKHARRKPSFDTKILFVNRQGKRLSDRSIRRKIKKYLKIAGLEKKISPTTMRHTLARHMLDNGVDLRSVQKLLGHRSRTSTQIYQRLH